jgi:hypothetical protein
MPAVDRPTQPEQHLAQPSEELVLAAVARAERHQLREQRGVPAWAILDHLALSPRGAAARPLRARLAALEANGWLERSRRHSAPTWALTASGLRRLRRAQHRGELAALPESPQHRAWRNARTVAAHEIERFRAGLAERSARAARLLEAEPPPHSDAWLELAEELQRACRRLASASHCLYEWAEPDDARADVDRHSEPGDAQLEPGARAVRRARRGGRRNVRLWNDQAL